MYFWPAISNSIMKRILIFFCVIFGLFTEGKSTTLSPEAQISLLTCSAGTEIYSYFGHSAIRVKDTTQNLDYVFNYGVFSFDTPHFVWRFCKGETDYMLAVQSMKSFLDTYYEERRDVYEQVLNLTPEEKQKLFDSLIENYKPENRYYRYNHFLDNCATRIRDQFEKATDGKMAYDTSINQPLSFRQMIHAALPDNSWSGFGIKLALGVPCDRKTTFAEKMFLPAYLQKDMASASLLRSDGKVPFSQPLQTLYKAPSLSQDFSLTSPAIVMMLFFLITLILTIREYQLKKRFLWLDFFVYLSFGIGGLILGFLCFYSKLEATGWNLNLLWALPTHFIYAFVLFMPSLKDKLNWYPKIITYILLAFLVSMFFLPQTFHWLVIPLSLTMLLRSAGISSIVRIIEKRKVL